jgi:hypothetical protein
MLLNRLVTARISDMNVPTFSLLVFSASLSQLGLHATWREAGEPNLTAVVQVDYAIRSSLARIHFAPGV